MIADADGVVPAGYQNLVAESYAGPKQIVHLPNGGQTVRASGPALDQLQSAIDNMWNHKTARTDLKN